MGATTGISWTSATYNPWHGCHKVSPGCSSCYMYQDKKRYGQDPNRVVQSKRATLLAPLKWQKEVEQGKRLGKDRMVFTCSWSDFFIEEADPWRGDVWEIIRQTPGLIYQILSKRPERIRAHLPQDWGDGWPNVWLGVSTENQEWFEKRWTILKTIPAAVRFLSYEPAIGPLSLESCYRDDLWPDQVLCGGESGSQARPCNIGWLRSIKDQCIAADVACWVKQYGSVPYELEMGVNDYTDEQVRKWASRASKNVYPFTRLKDRKGADPLEWSEDMRVQQFPEVLHA